MEEELSRGYGKRKLHENGIRNSEDGEKQMNREILFKGKRVDDGKWIHGDLLQCEGGRTLICTYVAPSKETEGIKQFEIDISLRDVIPETVSQYTGICDEKGNKIFENDLLGNELNRVEFLNGEWCINGDRPLFFMAKNSEIVENYFDKKEVTEDRETKQNNGWISIDERLPDTDDFILLSFSNFTNPLVGRYETDEDGSGAFYIGDELETCLSQNIFVNAWQPLPEPFKED